MEFIDTHAHLYMSDYEQDLEKVIERAKTAGIHKILLPNVDHESINPLLELCKTYPATFFPMTGIHPTSIKENYKDLLVLVEDSLKKHKFIAIGEVGIDLYWDKSFFTQQQEAFAHQIDLAREYSLPLVIHSREAFMQTLEVLQSKYNGTPYNGVFHSYSGNAEQARQIIGLGFKIGISGVVTFKNSNLGEVVKEIPLEHILTETDAPFLAPVPNRGKRNEPAYIVNIAQKIAELKQVPLEEVGETTTRTAKTLFKL